MMSVIGIFHQLTIFCVEYFKFVGYFGNMGAFTTGSASSGSGSGRAIAPEP